MLAHMSRKAGDALLADFRRVYGLHPHDLTPVEAAALAVNLPDGSMVWRVLNTPNAWTVDQHLTACLVDQMQMWMWSNSDPKKRGHRPKPLQRPGSQQEVSTRPTRSMSVEQLDRFMSQAFTPVREV